MIAKIETEHLILRVLSPKEAVLVSAFYSRNFDDFARYEPLIRRQSLSTHYQHQILDLETRYRKEGSRIRYYLFRKYDPFRTIGTVSFRELDKDGKGTTTVGYKVDRDFRRLGYAKETLTALIPIVEREYGVHIIRAEVLPTNRASQNLLAGLGFRRTALLENNVKLGGRYYDEYLYERVD